MKPDNMPDQQPLRIIAERRLLSALCQNSLEEGARETVVDRLRTCEFSAPEHEIVFLAWVQIRALHANPTRETIAAQVTRLGFPDVDFDSLFSAAPPTADEIAALLREE